MAYCPLGGEVYWLDSVCNKLAHIDQFLFSREDKLNNTYLKDIGVSSMEEMPTPMILGFGYYNQTWTDGAGYIFFKKSPQQLRATTFWGITTGYIGINYFGNIIQYYVKGTSSNQSAATIINNLAGELHDTEMSTAILANTTNFSWKYDVPWDEKVNFSTNPIRTMTGLGNRKYYTLSYRLKYNSTSNTTYLFVVNKDNYSIPDITITIDGFTTQNATTIGDYATGNATAGQVYTMVGGAFTIDLDAYDAQVFSISSSESSSSSSSQFIINATGGDATWSQFTQDNVTEDLGDLNIKIGEYTNNFDNANTNFVTLNGANLVKSTGAGYLNVSDLVTEYGIVTPNNPINTTKNITISYKFNIVNTGLYKMAVSYLRFNTTSNFTYDVFYGSTINQIRIRNVLGGVTTTLNSSTSSYPVTGTWYNAISKFNDNKREVWFNNNLLLTATDTNFSVADKWGLGVYNGCTFFDDVRVWSTTTGNLTTWHNWTDSNVTYQVTVNATTPENTNYSVYYRLNNTGDFISLASNQTGNQTIAITTQYQNTDVRIQLLGNETSTPELISVTYYAQAPPVYAPNITSWSNTKTNNDTSNINMNSSESVTFNATANQTITTWNWYVNGTNQNINYDNISLSYSSSGTRLVQVNATNSNGTSQTTSWNLTVQVLDTSTKWTYGIGGEFFQNSTIGSNKTCINQGDGSIGVCKLADNFNDNNTDGWNETGDLTGTWDISNGILNQSTTVPSYQYWNITSYENMSIFTKFKEYDVLTSYIDASDLRGNLSRPNTNPSWLQCQFSMGSPTGTRAHIYCYNGSSWLVVNNTATKTRYLNDWNYAGFFVNGTYFRGYHSNASYIDAMSIILSSGTSSQWLNGTTIQFGGQPNSAVTISWDEIRAVELDALGNQYLQGNYSMNYTVPASQYAKNITINGTYVSGTNYSLKYRQNTTGDYVVVEGVKTANTTIELPTPYYQNIDVRLELNATTSDTLWITNITIGTSATNDETTTFIPSSPISCSATQGNFWINTSWTSGSGNITNGYNSTNGTVWINNTLAYRNTTLSAHGWQNLTVYAWNSTDNVLSLTALTNNTQIINNVPVQTLIDNKTGNEGTWINVSILSSDLDGDTLTYATNRSDLFVQSSNNFSWLTNYSSTGVYPVTFSTTDSYGAVDTEIIIITINDVSTTTSGGGGGGATIQKEQSLLLQSTNPSSVDILGSGLNWEIKIMNEGTSEQEYIINWVLKTQSGSIIDSGVLSKKILQNETYTVPLTFMGLFPGNYAIKANVQYGIYQSEANQFFSVGINYSMTEVIILLSILTTIFLASLYFRKPKK